MKNHAHNQPRKMDQNQKSVLNALLFTHALSRAIKKLENGANIGRGGR